MYRLKYSLGILPVRAPNSQRINLNVEESIPANLYHPS
jgi:hypothetical protein